MLFSKAINQTGIRNECPRFQIQQQEFPLERMLIPRISRRIRFLIYRPKKKSIREEVYRNINLMPRNLGLLSYGPPMRDIRDKRRRP